MKEDKTVIEIFKNTRARLFKEKEVGDSYDDVINRLLDVEKHIKTRPRGI